MMDECTTSIVKMSLRDFFFIVFYKVRVFVGIWLMAIAITVLIAFSFNPVYETTAKILVKPYVDMNLLYKTPPGILRPNTVTPQDINSEIDMMLSTEVLRKVVTENGLAEGKPKNTAEKTLSALMDFFKIMLRSAGLVSSVRPSPVDEAVDILKGKLKVLPGTMSNMILISLTGNEPVTITDTVNTLIDAYIDRRIELNQTNKGLIFFETRTQLAASALKQAEAALREFNNRWSISDITAQRQGNIKVLETMRQSLADIRGNIAGLKTRIDQSKKKINALTSEFRDNLVLIEYYKSLLPLLVEMERIAMLYPKNSVEFQDISRQVAETRQRIIDQQNRLLDGSDIDLTVLMSQEASLSREIKRIEEESIFLTDKEVELGRLVRELKLSEKNYLLYMDKTEEARIDQQKDVSKVANVTPVSWAAQPSIPVFPKKGVMILLSVLIGFLMGVGGAFTAYYLDHTLKQPSELDSRARIASLGAIEVVN
ncbi:MAG: GumC family protein [Pseudomonadota bacterium]